MPPSRFTPSPTSGDSSRTIMSSRHIAVGPCRGGPLWYAISVASADSVATALYRIVGLPVEALRNSSSIMRLPEMLRAICFSLKACSIENIPPGRRRAHAPSFTTIFCRAAKFRDLSSLRESDLRAVAGRRSEFSRGAISRRKRRDQSLPHPHRSTATKNSSAPLPAGAIAIEHTCAKGSGTNHSHTPVKFPHKKTFTKINSCQGNLRSSSTHAT